MLKDKKINIIISHSSEYLGLRLNKYKDLNLIYLDKNKDKKNFFPDNEIYVRLKGVNKLSGRVIVLCSGCPNPNSVLIELEMILGILAQNKKIKKEVFFTYFPYGQQDKVFMNGEINYAEFVIKKLVNYFSVEKIYIIDAHFQEKAWTKKYPIKYVSGINLLKKYALEKDPNLIFLTPDSGAQRRTGLVGVKKDRKNSYLVEISNNTKINKIINSNNIGVIDDIIETGGTLSKFYDICKKSGANNICALITHGVLHDGIDKITKKYSILYITNSINNENIKTVDVSELAYKSIKENK